MFRISLDALMILDAIDRRGSLSAAATELHRVPSTISYSVARLEEDLGVQIYDRQGPKVSLTRAGEELLKEGRYLLRIADDLEKRVMRVASGWETELNIGLESLFAPISLETDIAAFCGVAGGTRLRFSRESLTGSWEALLDRRVDLMIGAPGQGPSGGGYVAEEIGKISFVFAVAPTHPLAKVKGKIKKEELLLHKAISVSDTARRLAPRTIGLMYGQNVVAVPDMQSKLGLQLSGIGFGFLPEPYARKAIASGALIKKEVEEPKPDETLYLTWRAGEVGAALEWWIERMRHVDLTGRLIESISVV
ncbi:LysR family transcriptional regulator [Undibacterium jejuense]|uniref:LysR family transcriptional regulator n=1 Tax=Undibacterium jejuense TaxID=1344949 RepID=A0A923HJL2_9BURK|nr:LysR substrate-binding domain-containing protein [Undibacterium jejuense]MBC3863420.1 LysR family transcriptional regulator [Undibacterium jejuense]